MMTTIPKRKNFVTLNFGFLAKKIYTIGLQIFRSSRRIEVFIFSSEILRAKL